MSDVTIFKAPGAVSVSGKRAPTALGQALASDLNSRRIQTNTNGTFKRIVNGEQIGNAIRGEIDVIVVAALPKVSRVFYAGKYDPNAKPTLPDCWSNLGDKPEAAAPNKQAPNCADCGQNVKGSGDNGGRACRFQRRIGVLLSGDDSGELYQFNVPAKSLFGKGTGNVHPFESYIKFLLANGESPDTVVTNISYDLNADSMELLFTPVRNITDEEYALVVAAQASPEADRCTRLTVAQTDGATKKPENAKPIKVVEKVERSAEPDDEDVGQPVKRASARATDAPVGKKALADMVSEWGADD